MRQRTRVALRAMSSSGSEGRKRSQSGTSTSGKVCDIILETAESKSAGCLEAPEAKSRTALISDDDIRILALVSNTPDVRVW